MTVTYYFTYTYGNGDYYAGYGFASASLGYYYGLAWSTSNETGNNGFYTITGVTDWGYDDSRYEGQVFVQSYYDSESSTLAPHLTPVPGYGVSGLGSEYSYMANNVSYTPTDTFGWYGYYEADFATVRQIGGGKNTPPDSADADNPQDFSLPGSGGINEWEQDFDLPYWSATADIQFSNGQTTNIPLVVSDEFVSDEPDDEIVVADGNDTLVWEISDSASFGFSQEMYIFNENDAHIGENDDNFENDGIVNIELSLNSTIKIATIIIADNDSAFPTFIGDANNNNLAGSDGNSIVYAREGNDYVSGGNGNDDLYGETGDDSLLGYAGNDYLNGGSGNDYYLDGGDGNDVLDGLAGNDGLYGGAGNDRIGGNSGSDYLNGGDDDDDLYGDADNDFLEGGLGNDTLEGGTGVNTLVGGAGDDLYRVGSNTDILFEYPSEGIDAVESAVSFTLTDNLENLTLTGNNYANGTGNVLDNSISGDSTNNYLFGGNGNDTLRGEDQFNDDFIEGNDNDVLYGEAGNDTLICAPGYDTLIGGAGADTFNIDSYSSFYEVDTITDFNLWEGDKFAVSASALAYGGLLTIGALLSEQFTVGAAAADESDRFIYDSSTGGLFYDPDGTGFITGSSFVYGQTQIAFLSPGLSLISSDISIID